MKKSLKKSMFGMLILFVIGVSMAGWAYAIDWLTPKAIGTQGNQYVEWIGTAAADGTASACTKEPIVGELREIMYLPETSYIQPVANTAALTVKNGWAKVGNSATHAFTSSDADFSGTFGGASGAELYKNTGELVVRGKPVFTISNCFNANLVPAQFRLIFIFCAEPDALPVEE